MNRKTLVGALAAMTMFFLFIVAASATHAPENIRLVKSSAKTVTVGWNTVPGVTGYGLWVDGTRVATAGATATQAKFGTPLYRQYVLGVQALKQGGETSTITVEPRWVTVSTFVPPEPNPPPPSPVVTITSAPQNPTTLTTAAFAWSATNATSFQCKLDNAAAASCTSPTTYNGLGLGNHTFVVTATGAGGSAQATSTWTVQTQQPPTGNVTLTQIDGGTSYYGKFTNSAGMDAPSYFPIGVWGAYNQTPANRDLDASAGINTYVWAADENFIDDIRGDGRFKIVYDQSMNRSAIGTESPGWLLTDEIDMQQANSAGAAAARNQLNQILSGLPNDGRFRYNNYGKGVIFWNSDSDAEQYVNDFQQVASSDIYWFTEGDVCAQSQGGELLGFNRALTAAECHRASNYGAQVARMRALDAMDGVRQPIWNFVETGHPFDNNMNGHRSIAPAEMRAAVWQSIIAGARGILYFQHSFGGTCVGDHHTTRSNCEGTRPMLISVNAQIKSLASVLNSPTVTDGFTANSAVKAMAKWDGNNFYVFAGSLANTSSTGTFAIPCVGNATATVVGENRTVPVANGSFSDAFADGNTVHIYRVDGGGRCGL